MKQRQSINVTGSLSTQDYGAAVDIIRRAVKRGLISQESADKAETFIHRERSRKPVKASLRDRVLLATFYTLSWGLTAVTVSLAVYTRYFNR